MISEIMVPDLSSASACPQAGKMSVTELIQYFSIQPSAFGLDFFATW